MSEVPGPPPIQPLEFVPPPVQSEPEVAPEPLAKLPIPPFVLALAAVTLIAFLIGLVRFPGAVREASTYERAQKLVSAGQAAPAEAALAPLVKSHPDSKNVRLTYAEACMRTQNYRGAVEQLQYFEGKEVSEEDERRLNAIVAELDRKFPEAPKDKKK